MNINLAAPFLFLAIAVLQLAVVYAQTSDYNIYCSYQRLSNETIVQVRSESAGPVSPSGQYTVFGGCGKVSGAPTLQNQGDYYVVSVDLPRDVDPNCLTDALR